MSVVLCIFVCVSGVFLIAEAALASMQVFPTHVYFEAGQNTTTVTVRNVRDTPLTIQVSPRDWGQGEDGGDQYKETDDLLVFPRMVTIDGNGEQTLRLAYRGDPVTTQRAFRMLVEEVPIDEPGKQMAMRFAVTMSMPVFIDPPEMVQDFSLGQVTVSEGAAHVSFINKGSVHGQVGEIDVQLLSSGGQKIADVTGNGWYVLPGMTRSFAVPLPEADCRKAARIAITVAGKDNEDPPVPPMTGSAAMPGGTSCKAPAPKTAE